MDANAMEIISEMLAPPSAPAAVGTTLPLVYGAMFAFLSQLSSIGKGMQKVGVQNLPELSLRWAVVKQYMMSRTWRNGLLLDVTGASFGLAALTVVPISVAQPIFCNGLVLLALYSHFYLKEQLGRREWLSILLCFLGTLLLACTLVPRDWSRTDIRWMQAKLGAVLLLALPLLAVLEMAARRAKRSPNRSAIELLAGVQTGLCIGVGNATLASGLQSTSKSWLEHVARQHIGSKAWPSTSIASSRWLHLLCAGTFVVCGALLNASHPLFANRGYQHGRVVLISIYTALVSMATGVLMGVGVLDEAWPARPSMSFLRHLAFLLIVGGVWSLNWANIKALTKQQVPARLSEVVFSRTAPSKSMSATGSRSPAPPLPMPLERDPEEAKGHKEYVG
ncbi:hypothetical protein AB1Y20_008116 [Prymnesium parvum]|uniref:Magnesium transporter n=1 Tax=Prymnesium parvum TaxID=97485 RepID=A0AB34IVS9_PRYPA|mmetsp:Transcript_10484/g.25237  ORF Transcript_10484/g.25237 Transcript_10484/m.25237 type:complete len:393 (-) Transcript_10484:370-1548(-)